MLQDTRFDGDVIGFDLSDRSGCFCVLSRDGQVRERGKVSMTQKALRSEFEGRTSKLLVIEVGTHSPWVSEVLESCGHRVLVANPRQLPLIYKNCRKNDPTDAENLARIGRADPTLLYPIQHRQGAARGHLAVIRSRVSLVEVRTKLVNHVRGVVKASGNRVPSCSTAYFAKKARDVIPDELRAALDPILDQIESTSQSIAGYDKKIAELAKEQYPVTEALAGPKGVGTLTALAFVLTIQDPSRFEKSRSVGGFLGLTPRQSQSGDYQPELRITKAGDQYLRCLLVQCAQYMLGHHGEDCDLRRWGLRLCDRGGKKSKKRAMVAVARKIAVLLHHLWRTGEVYDPLHNAKKELLSA